MNPPPTPAPFSPALITALQSSSFPIPSSSFLQPILSPPSHTQSSSSSTPHTLTPVPTPRTLPLPSLLATTKHRLLSLSLTTPNLLSPATHSLPTSLLSPMTRESILEFDVPVQVLDIEDIGRSKGDLLLALESERKGERISGREVIRVVDNAGAEGAGVGSQFPGTQTPSTGNNTTNSINSSGPYKLLLQDHKGTQIYAFESERVEKIGFPPMMHIGCKIMLKRGMRVRRGVVWLERGGCVVLGGRVEEMDRKWREGWEERLRSGVEGGGG